MRPIDADALYAPRSVRKVTEYDETGCGIDYLAVPWEVIEDAPTLDCEPVRHGKWIRANEEQVYFDVEYVCSECAFTVAVSGIGTPLLHGYKHCPNCGAKMDGGKA